MISLWAAFLLAIQDAPGPKRVQGKLGVDGTLTLSEKAVPLADIPKALQSYAGVRELTIRTDPATPFSYVQRVMTAARDAGIESVQFSSDSDAPPIRLAGDPRRALRLKVREGPKGPEIVILRESAAVSLDDLRTQLGALEKQPVLIDADDEIPYTLVKRIVEACTEKGFSEVSFAGSAKSDRAVRVALVSDDEDWEYRYVRNFLVRSSEFQLVRLDEADVALVGRASIDEKRLVEFVKRGGGVVWLDRPGIEEISPVRLKPADPEQEVSAPQGAFHSAWRVDAVDSDATVKVESPRGGLVVVQSVDKGRAVYVGAKDTWRWRESGGDEPHFGPFWKSVLRWAREP